MTESTPQIRNSWRVEASRGRKLTVVPGCESKIVAAVSLARRHLLIGADWAQSRNEKVQEAV